MKPRFCWSLSFLCSMVAVYVIQFLSFFAGELGLNVEATAGVIEVSNTLCSFSPIFGLAIAVSALVIFTVLSFGFAGIASSGK